MLIFSITKTMITYNISICHPHAPVLALGKTSFRTLNNSLFCWGSPSFTMNATLPLVYFGINVGIAFWNAHLKENCCWLRIQIQRNPTFSQLNCKMKSSVDDILVVWVVTSHQITSEQSMKSCKAGAMVHVIETTRISEEFNPLSFFLVEFNPQLEAYLECWILEY